MQKKQKGIYKVALFIICFILCGSVLLFRQNLVDSSISKPLKVKNVNEAIQKLEKLGDEYGFENAFIDLTEKNTISIDGDTYFRLQQNYKGIPVYGKMIICATNENKIVMTITGDVVDVDETLNTIPSLLKENAISIIQNYINKCSSSYTIQSEDVSLETENLCIYIDNETGQSHLAYRLMIDIYEFVIDAHNGEILFIETIYRTSTYSGDLLGQKIEYKNVNYSKEDGKYYLFDEDKEIHSMQVLNELTFANGTFVRLWDSSRSIEWVPGEQPDPNAVDAYVNTGIAYDYFDKVLGVKGSDGAGSLPTYVFTGLEWYKSGSDVKNIRRNASASITCDDEGNPKYAGIYIGEGINPTLSAYLDVVAHEYMHNVEKMHCGMIYNGESGAIMEALSDIFGELVQAWHTKGTPDWIHGVNRNISNPQKSNNPASYGDGNWIDNILDIFDNDGVHRNSTVISHAAYLMWNGIDGQIDKMISTEELAKIWYRAMLMMPVDCNFSTCRQMVEWAALAVDGITDLQRQCIAEAFDAVGIYDENSDREDLFNCDYNVVQNTVLNVYNREEKLHPRYIVEITGTIDESELSYATNIFSDTVRSLKKIETVSSAKSLHLDLPNGYYTFRITDQNNSQYEYVFTVSVSEQGTEDIIELYTDFEDKLIVDVSENKSEEYVSEETELSIYDIAESASGLYCVYAINGDFDDDNDEEIYALLCASSSDYSNGQLWHLTTNENRCVFYIENEEFEMICNTVKKIPEWIVKEFIDKIDNIDEFAYSVEEHFSK